MVSIFTPKSRYERSAYQAYAKEQAFTLDPVTPPAGGSDWYRIIDFGTGECLTATSPAIRSLPCDGALDQAFLETSVSVDGRSHFTYRSASQGGVIDASSKVLTIAPATGDAAQQFTMGLTAF